MAKLSKAAEAIRQRIRREIPRPRELPEMFQYRLRGEPALRWLRGDQALCPLGLHPGFDQDCPDGEAWQFPRGWLDWFADLFGLDDDERDEHGAMVVEGVLRDAIREFGDAWDARKDPRRAVDWVWGPEE